MSFTKEHLEEWLKEPEIETLEFKASRKGLHFDELARYCAAIANDGGGYLIIGVTDKRPREVLGTEAYQAEYQQATKHRLTSELRLKVEIHEIPHPDGRVVVFKINSRPIGVPIKYKNSYPMRSGESLTDMTTDKLKEIFDETVHDFSAQICSQAKFEDLDPEALEVLKNKFHKKSKNDEVVKHSHQQILEDLGLTDEGQVTYAALILCGRRKSIRKYLAQAEIIFEFRKNESDIEYQDRMEYRDAFLLYEDLLWSKIDSRNEKKTIQIGFFKDSIASFNEEVIREAILNAVSHRDYQMPESCFIKQSPSKISVVSPGGFPKGVNQENIIWKQSPRNRLLAETLAKCGYVERSGQGVDIMFKQSILEGKPVPSFFGTDESQIVVNISGIVQDEKFLMFLQNIESVKMQSFSVEDLLVINYINEKSSIPERLQPRLPGLLKNGIVERQGKKYILSRGYYEFAEKEGEYTREKGLDKETNKALLLKHITDYALVGSKLSTLQQVLPTLPGRAVQQLIAELRDERKIHRVGNTKGAMWFPGAGPSGQA